MELSGRNYMEINQTTLCDALNDWLRRHSLGEAPTVLHVRQRKSGMFALELEGPKNDPEEVAK